MEPFLQMIMALLARNQQAQPIGGGLGSTPNQWGAQRNYTGGGGMMRPGFGQPNNIPTGQPPLMGQLPRQPQGPRLSGPIGMGNQGQNQGQGQFPGAQSPGIDYRNGMLRTGGPQISRMTSPFSVR